MNERIRELAQEVFSFKYKSNPNELNPDHNMDHIHKFAELIVQECCKTLEEMHMWQSVNNQNYPSAWHNAVDQGIDNIKEHFGVEL